MTKETLKKKLNLIMTKRHYEEGEIHFQVGKPTWFTRHCGLPLLRVKLFKVDKSCPTHTYYNIGPVDEFICQCPECTFSYTEDYMGGK